MVYIPGFLVSRVYERGSLCNTQHGFRFNFTNRMTPLRISGMRDVSLEVDGCPYPPDKVGLELGGRAIGLAGGSFEDTVTFAKDDKLTIDVLGSPLAAGDHKIRIAFVTNEYGGASLKVTDRVGDRRAPSLWQRLWEMLRGGAPSAITRPLVVSGELGGVPLDPDFARMEAILRREEPDRVPLFEAEIDAPIMEWFLGRTIDTAADQVEFHIRAGYDFVPVVPPFLAPKSMHAAGNDDGSLNSEDANRAWVVESQGQIKTVADIEAFPWPRADQVDFSGFEEVAALLPPKMKTLGILGPTAIFGNASQAMGLENFSYALYDDIRVIEALFEILGPTFVEIAKRLVTMPRLGAVLMPDDLAYTESLLVSPEIYKKYVFPWYREIGTILGDAGVPFIYHSDGRLWDVFDDLADCGIKGIHPIEPKAMDIADVKRRYGDRFCIFGNIDLEYTLTHGSTQEVEALVKKRIQEVGPGGGYGLSSANSVPDYVKPENYRAMIEATKRWGAYPLAV